MGRYILVFGLLALPFHSLVASQALAVTAKQKAETCKLGADHEKLAGAKRKAFMAKCMAPSDAPVRRAKKPQPN